MHYQREAWILGIQSNPFSIMLNNKFQNKHRNINIFGLGKQKCGGIYKCILGEKY